MIRINCCNAIVGQSEFIGAPIRSAGFQVTHIGGVPDIIVVDPRTSFIGICVESTARSVKFDAEHANYRDFDTGEVAEWLKAAVC